MNVRRHRDSSIGGDDNRNRALAIIAAVLAVFLLRETYAVTMPLAAGAVVIAAIWPVQVWLNRRLPTAVSYVGTVLTMLLILCIFTFAVFFSIAQVVSAFTRHWDKFEQIFQSATQWADAVGIPLGGKDSYGRLLAFGQNILANAYTTFVYLGFISLIVILGLPEVSVLRTKLRATVDEGDRHEVLDTTEKVAEKIRLYLGTSTVMSLLTGVASALWAFTVGLDLALVWGVLNFLLNYIPVVGNIIGIIPPALYALVQFQSPVEAAIVFAGFAVIQIVISSFIYPMLQGRSLSLSPIAIIVALSFWSWVWGIAGAIIAIPITIALIEICAHF
jgi:predicted PurR-regulated permease PerM